MPLRQESRMEPTKNNVQNRNAYQSIRDTKLGSKQAHGIDDEQKFLDNIRDKFDKLNNKSEKMLSITSTNPSTHTSKNKFLKRLLILFSSAKVQKPRKFRTRKILKWNYKRSSNL